MTMIPVDPLAEAPRWPETLSRALAANARLEALGGAYPDNFKDWGLTWDAIFWPPKSRQRLDEGWAAYEAARTPAMRAVIRRAIELEVFWIGKED